MASFIFMRVNWSNICTIGYVCSVFLLHILPAVIFDAVQPRRELFIPADLLVHATMFFPWMFMDGSVFIEKVSGQRSKYRLYWLACGSSACIIFECLQLLTASRSFSFLDMGCNLLGVALGALVAGWLYRT